MQTTNTNLPAAADLQSESLQGAPNGSFVAGFQPLLMTHALIKAAMDATEKIHQFIAPFSLFKDGMKWAYIDTRSKGLEGRPKTDVWFFIGDEDGLQFSCNNAAQVLKKIQDFDPKEKANKKLHELRAEVAKLEAQVAR